ncbi:MAG: putative ABC transporter permease [Candidatus Enterenecus sp.]
MRLFLSLAFLFAVGAVLGWVLELFFRRFISAANPERKWINPGFCVGPYVPLYGFGLCILYLLASLEDKIPIQSPGVRKAVLFLVMAIAMTAIEYIAGVLALRVLKVRLWDYSDEWANLQGIICPKFSLAWAVLGAVYYFLLHPHVLKWLDWLSRNLAFSFVVGLFFGVFLIDVAYSVQLLAKLKKFADDNDVIVRYEHLKAHIRSVQDRQKQKAHFLFAFRSEQPLAEHLKEMRDTLERRRRKGGK